MLVISFATPGPYEQELEALRATLGDIPAALFIQKDPMTWRAATLSKPYFILYQLCAAILRAVDGPVIWLDADARVDQPAAFREYVAMVAEKHPGKVGFHRLPRPDDPRGPECVLSTIIFAPPLWRCLPLVCAWLAECEERPGERTPDQEPLEHLLAPGSAIDWYPHTFPIPPEFCWIDGGLNPDVSEMHYGKRTAIVRQTQASRRLKNAGA